MRIRKNRKFAPVLCSSGFKVPHNPHVCLLNQSPWDAIPFSPDPDFDFESSLLQFRRDARSDANANSGDSDLSVERETKAIDRITAEKEEKLKRIEMSEFKFEREQVQSKFKFLESSRSNLKSDDSGCEEDEEDGLRRSKRRASKKESCMSSNRREFYYYSEFGPLRGKKRVIRGDNWKFEISKDEETDIISCFCY